MADYLEIVYRDKLHGAFVTYKNDSERALVERAKKEPEAFGILFDKYYDQIYRYILHRTADKDLADDLTADTFHKALEKLWRFKWMNLPFSAWLYRIALNEVRGYFRKKQKYQNTEIDNESGEEIESYENPDNRLSEQSLFYRLHQAIKNLDQKYQEVITLKYFEEMSIKEICGITGKAEGTVKSLIHRGLKLLENEIDEELYKEFKDE